MLEDFPMTTPTKIETTKTQFNQSEAARITGKARNTIAAHLKSGKLSSVCDRDGNVLIDHMELIRVYGDECDFSRVEPYTETKPDSPPSSNIDQASTAQLHTAEQLLEAQKEERQRERDRMQCEIDRLEQMLERSEERQNKITLLLEDRTRGIGDWEQSFQSLQRKVDTQQQKLLQDRKKLHQQALQYKQAYELERDKSAWNRFREWLFS